MRPEEKAGAVTLAQVAPELVSYIAAGLVEHGRSNLIPGLNALRVHRMEMNSHHVSLETVKDLDGRAMMENPGRERIWIGRPRGVRRRSWGITVEVIKGAIWHIGLSNPGILRSTFQTLARDYARVRTPIRT
jgi:hypothetical protein